MQGLKAEVRSGKSQRRNYGRVTSVEDLVSAVVVLFALTYFAVQAIRVSAWIALVPAAVGLLAVIGHFVVLLAIRREGVGR